MDTRNIVLVGFMGTGKTTVGQQLAEQTGMPLVDMDAMIEQRAGKKARCGACGVGIQVLVEEPRCSCGYLLYDFAGEKCPECGLAIPDRWRWNT